MENRSLDPGFLENKGMSNWDIIDSLEEQKHLVSGCTNLLTTGLMWNEEDTRAVLIHVLNDVQDKLREICYDLADRFEILCGKEE